MRIALVPHSYLPATGGVQTAVHNLACELIRRGHQVAIVTWGNCFRKRSHISENNRQTGIPVHLCDFIYPQLHRKYPWWGVRSFIHFGLCAPITYVRLVRILRGLRPDVINVHFLWTNAFYVSWTQPLLTAPIVLTAHGPMDVSERPGETKPPLWSHFRRRSLEKADFLTGSCTYVLEKAREHYPKDRSLCAVTPNGINLADFSMIDGQAHSRPYIFGIGRLVHDKGFDVLLQAFAQLRDEWDGDLLIAGDGPERRSLQTLISDLELESRAQLIGPVHDAAVRNSLYQHCEFVVQPSRREGFSIVLLESMACQKPVIATRVFGTPELVEEEQNGLLVEPGDVHGLVVAMRRLLADRDLRERMGQRNRTLIENEYTWEKATDRYEEVYRSVMGADVAQLGSGN